MNEGRFELFILDNEGARKSEENFEAEAWSIQGKSSSGIDLVANHFFFPRTNSSITSATHLMSSRIARMVASSASAPAVLSSVSNKSSVAIAPSSDELSHGIFEVRETERRWSFAMICCQSSRCG